MGTTAKQHSKAKDETPLDAAFTEQPVSNTAVAAPASYEDEGGSGFENMDVHFFKVPFLNILQKGSPEVDEDSAEHVEGAKAGMLIHSISRQMFDGKEQGIAVVPLHCDRKYMEWVPRDQGGGLVGVYSPTDPKVLSLIRGKSEFDKITTADGNQLQETFNAYVLVLWPNGRTEGVVLSFSSSNIGPFKDWMSIARAQTFKNGAGDEQPYPLYAHVYRLKTKFNENKKGTWYGWTASFEGGTPDTARIDPASPLAKAAKEFRAMVTSGQAQADLASMENNAPTDADKDAF